MLTEPMEKRAEQLTDIEAEILANDIFKKRWRWDKGNVGRHIMGRKLTRAEKSDIGNLAREYIHPTQYIPFIHHLTPRMRKGTVEELAPKLQAYFARHDNPAAQAAELQPEVKAAALEGFHKEACRVGYSCTVEEAVEAIEKQAALTGELAGTFWPGGLGIN